MGSCSSKQIELSIDVIEKVLTLASQLVSEGNKQAAKKVMLSINVDKVVRNDILSGVKRDNIPA